MVGALAPCVCFFARFELFLVGPSGLSDVSAFRFRVDVFPFVSGEGEISRFRRSILCDVVGDPCGSCLDLAQLSRVSAGGDMLNS